MLDNKKTKPRISRLVLAEVAFADDER